MTDNKPRSKSKWDPAGVRIERCQADPNDLAYSTLNWLGNTHPPVGDDRLVAELFKMSMRSRPPGMTVYANPVVRVTTASPSREFLVEARRQQRSWIKQLNNWLFSAGRVKGHYATVGPIIRQLEFTGVLIVNGKHVRPDQWPDPNSFHCDEKVVGRRFGRLTVIEELPGRNCRCRCQCGRTTFKRLKHLVAGRTKSCGCLRDEKRARSSGAKKHEPGFTPVDSGQQANERRRSTATLPAGYKKVDFVVLRNSE
jgi:hypothetical protein